MPLRPRRPVAWLAGGQAHWPSVHSCTGLTAFRTERREKAAGLQTWSHTRPHAETLLSVTWSLLCPAAVPFYQI